MSTNLLSLNWKQFYIYCFFFFISFMIHWEITYHVNKPDIKHGFHLFKSVAIALKNDVSITNIA